MQHDARRLRGDLGRCIGYLPTQFAGRPGEECLEWQALDDDAGARLGDPVPGLAIRRRWRAFDCAVIADRELFAAGALFAVTGMRLPFDATLAYAQAQA